MDRDKRQTLFRSYEKLLNPQKLRANLLSASLYLTSYELMRSSVVDNVRGFFSIGSDAREHARYKREVLRLYPKDAFQATCLWVQNNAGLSSADIREIQELRNKRNQVAHELPKLIADVDASLDLSWLHRIRAIVAKFDRWWLRTFEMDLPDITPDDDIHSGNMILMDLILRTVDGREGELDEIFRTWLKAMQDSELSTGS